MLKFAFRAGHTNQKEEKAIAYVSIMKPQEYTYKVFQKPSDVPEDFIPAGTIDWVHEVLGAKLTPDYYPTWYAHMLHRKVWRADKWPMEPGLFVKPADLAKRFLPRITVGTYRGKKKGPYWVSEKVTFVNEWRYYFVNGQQVYAGWYDGNNDDEPAPVIYVHHSPAPEGWCGVLDLGYLDNGLLSLVEAGEPYSVGWYGKLAEGEIYANFLSEGWKYMKNVLLPQNLLAQQK